MLKKFALATALVVASCVGVKAADYSTFAMAQLFKMIGTSIDAPGKWIPITKGDSHKDYLMKLVAKSPLPILFAPPQKEDKDNHIWGRNNHKMIWVDSTMPANNQLATLAHEIGHSLEPDDIFGHAPGEVFAEAVANVYCKRIGLDTSASSFVYFAHGAAVAAEMTPGDVYSFLITHSKEIDDAVDSLLDEK